jgi:hypothetical protein
VTKPYIQPGEVAKAIEEPLNEFYGEVHLLYLQMIRGKSIRFRRDTGRRTLPKKKLWNCVCKKRAKNWNEAFGMSWRSQHKRGRLLDEPKQTQGVAHGLFLANL